MDSIKQCTHPNVVLGGELAKVWVSISALCGKHEASCPDCGARWIVWRWLPIMFG